MKEDERGEKQKPWKKEETLRENQLNSKKKKKKKDFMKKEIKSCLERATGICSNQAKEAKTSCNCLLKVYYSTSWRVRILWEYSSPQHFKLWFICLSVCSCCFWNDSTMF
jgi:hypothetical protein